MTIPKMYKSSEIEEATGMNHNEFGYCRRKIGIAARGRGVKSLYTESEARRIISAYYCLCHPRPRMQERVDELRQMVRDCGY